jgi:hypothetical protein
VEDILHNAGAAVTVGRGGKAKAVAAVLHQQDVVKQGKHVVNEEAREGGAGQAAPNQPPREVRQAGLDLGRGQSGSKLPVDEFGGDIQQGGGIHARQGEHLLQEAGEVFVERGNVLGMEASPQIRKKMAEAEPHPVGNMASGSAPPRQAVTGLLG